MEAADALRILEKESHLKSVSLTQVQMGAVREVAGQDRARTVAEAWREAGAQLNVKGKPRQVPVVCATHEEIGNVTEAIRADRKQAGELGESKRVERHVPLNYTTAQKSAGRNF